MRKLHKEQALELLRTLYSASNELKEYSDDQFIDLCADIQEFIEGIYTYFVDVFGNEHKFTIQVEKLFKKIYMVAQKQIESQSLSAEVAQFITELEATMPDKIEVVFFCYKASMSDCFESVYFAAKKDPSCDAYFVPIPYFDRNADGTFGEEHLEGEGYYSDEYELTNWQEYDVETRKPDVIFIMNPYDDGNKVTSVHPFFYSKRLKQHTGCLVYIEYGLPYYVYNNPLDDKVQEEIKNSTLFFPALLYSDVDIRYSKQLADLHKQRFLLNPEILNKCGFDIETKHQALGSPKFDKIYNTNRDSYNIPKEWEDKIVDKKVILYNTSIEELLRTSNQQKNEEGEYSPENNRYFIKLKTILKDVQANDNVILWWRPHPLFVATLHSIHPQLAEEYNNIVDNYINENKGIFDNTEDLHRAIAYSDAMISDRSSLLLLYTATGKPFYTPSISKKLKNPKIDSGKDFKEPLNRRLMNMSTTKGSNIGNWNLCIWWDGFLEEDVIRNTRFEDYTNRFLDYVVNRDKYEEAEEYKKLQLKMISDFVVNSDGTAGQKIYDYIKKKCTERE